MREHMFKAMNLLLAAISVIGGVRLANIGLKIFTEQNDIALLTIEVLCLALSVPAVLFGVCYAALTVQNKISLSDLLKGKSPFDS